MLDWVNSPYLKPEFGPSAVIFKPFPNLRAVYVFTVGKKIYVDSVLC